ncbi:O-antigen polymerase [Enterococcus durans]|uniref:O-antigen polymerase n=1 Tax=Enterococcus TaxID=1350 RepID=UPI0022E37AC3|nr:O-antigen polymerase [Enterococcus durans]
MYLLWILIAIIAMFIFKDKRINLFNPIFIFVTLWGGLYILYSLNIFNAFPKITIQFTLIIIIGIVCYLLGYFIGGYLPGGKKKVDGFQMDLKKVHRYSTIIYIGVVASLILTIVLLGLPPTLGGSIIRENYYIPGIEQFFLFIYVFWFLSLYQISVGHKVKVNLLLITTSLLVVLIKGNKFPLVYFVILIMFFLRKKSGIALKYIILSGVSILGAFSLASIILYNDEIVQNAKVFQTGYTLFESSLGRILFDPLAYLLCNIMNLINVMSKPSPYYLGLSSFKGVLSLFGLDSQFDSSYQEISNYWKSNLQIPWLTTGTFFKDFYLDFGIIGILGALFFIGALIGYFYKSMNLYIDTGRDLSSKLLARKYIFFSLYFAVIISFFTNYLSSVDFIRNLILFLIIIRLTRKKKEFNL